MRVTLTTAAKADLDQIFFYTLEKWGLEQARQYVHDLYTALDDLATGKRTAHPLFQNRDYKRIKVGAHVVIFIEQPDEYRVVRILHQRMDIMRHLDTANT